MFGNLPGMIVRNFNKRTAVMVRVAQLSRLNQVGDHRLEIVGIRFVCFRKMLF